jgi:hypothetical protein
MTLETIRQLALSGGGSLLIIMTIIQIAPIKFNPWSWFGRCIGRAINGEVLTEVKELKDDLNDHKQKSEERHATLCRTHILRFGDEILHGVLHSKEHYDSVLIDIDNYENYCAKHPGYKNGVAEAAIEHIKQSYQNHLSNNSFLK